MYVYNDEDNVPMNDFMDEHNPTVYSSRMDMKAYEAEIPFSDSKPDDGCWNCLHFDWRHEACTINWNNMDEDYYNPNTDDRELTDYCEYHETDPDADPECLELGGNEP